MSVRKTILLGFGTLVSAVIVFGIIGSMTSGFFPGTSHSDDLLDKVMNSIAAGFFTSLLLTIVLLGCYFVGDLVAIWRKGVNTPPGIKDA